MIQKTANFPLAEDIIQPSTTHTAQQRWAIVLKNEAIAHLITQGEDVVTLYVKEKYRRQGYAEALLKEALTEIPTLILEVRASNIAAQKLYEKLGFQHINTRKNYYTSPMENGFMYKKMT